MSRTIPTINTPRMSLRAMRAEDFNRFAEIWAMPAVVEHIRDRPRPRMESWDSFLRNAGHWQITGFGQWAVQVHRKPQMDGQVGFFFGSRSLGDDFDPYPEAGWVLAPEVQGEGLGLEAVRAAHDWFDRIIAGPTVCIITPDNIPSMMIAEKLGYRPLRDLRMDGAEVVLMHRRGPPV